MFDKVKANRAVSLYELPPRDEANKPSSSSTTKNSSRALTGNIARPRENAAVVGDSDGVTVTATGKPTRAAVMLVMVVSNE